MKFTPRDPNGLTLPEVEGELLKGFEPFQFVFHDDRISEVSTGNAAVWKAANRTAAINHLNKILRTEDVAKVIKERLEEQEMQAALREADGFVSTSKEDYEIELALREAEGA